MYVSDERLTEIHAKVYNKHGYPFQEGLKAFMRGRRWAKENDRTAKPPAGIAGKLLLWAEINSLIQKEVIRLREEEVIKFNKEGAKNGETTGSKTAGNGDNSANSGKPDGGVTNVSPGSSGD